MRVLFVPGDYGWDLLFRFVMQSFMLAVLGRLGGFALAWLLGQDAAVWANALMAIGGLLLPCALLAFVVAEEAE